MQWRGSGLAMPVFSIRTQASIGCGEFQDIKAMVDFVAATGMRVLQVHPSCVCHARCSHAAIKSREPSWRLHLGLAYDIVISLTVTLSSHCHLI